MAPQQQVVSAKEASLFKNVVKFYEDKQYKRGLKTADQILKKNPKSANTIAMKALILNHQGKTDQAFALAKEALTLDMKSNVCWHVYGMMYRYHKNFEEAIKAYKFALKLEPSSQQILRDLASLQVQTRDTAGYLQSRHTMLQMRPHLRENWTGLAVAYHMCGQLQEAERILNSYEGTLKQTLPRTDFENADAILYKNALIAEQGDIERALDHLETEGKKNLDNLTVMERRAKYLRDLGRKDEAVKAQRALLDRNPDHSDYYLELIKVLGIPDDDTEAKKAVFDEYAHKYPRCDAARRLPLDFLQGDAFKTHAKAYLGHMLDKGVPSTFANLKQLYTDPSKKQSLLELAQEYLDGQSEASGGDVSKGKAAALYYMAQHYNYHLSQDLDKATMLVDKAIEMDPKSVDFTMTKARIWKHRGNTQKASEEMDRARQLDTKDRYINCKAAKYQLRNDENAEALQTMGLFTRQDIIGGPIADLIDMQCIWYLTEDGEAYARQGNIGMALKRFHSIFDIFEQWQVDQLDFHTFSLRKGQVRAYMSMIKWEDRLREHPFYSRAALAAIDVYLSLHDKPMSERKQVNGTDEATKKALKKMRKEQQRLEKEAAEAAAKRETQKNAMDEFKPDNDPLGLKLADTKEPLIEAMNFLVPLLQFSPKHIDAQLAGFEVFLRRKKYLMAIRCLNAARELDASHPRVHEQTLRLRHALNTDSDIPERTQSLARRNFTSTDGQAHADLLKLNTHFKTEHNNSPLHLLAATRADRALDVNQQTCEAQLIDILDMENATFDVAGQALGLLRTWHSGMAATFKEKAHARWPEVTLFNV